MTMEKRFTVDLNAIRFRKLIFQPEPTLPMTAAILVRFLLKYELRRYTRLRPKSQLINGRGAKIN